jgi:hypothetical protein
VSEELSARARAILDAAERLAGGEPALPAPPPPTPPAAADSPPATAAQLAALAEQLRVVVETVRELSERVDALAAQGAGPTPAPPPAPAPAAPAAPAHEDAPRLLAVELAVAGATRADVDARLRERFGVSSTAELLDEVFGVGSSPSARLPWGGGTRG